MTFKAICQICDREYQGDDDLPAQHCGECEYCLAAMPPLARAMIYSLVSRIKKLEDRVSGRIYAKP